MPLPRSIEAFRAAQANRLSVCVCVPEAAVFLWCHRPREPFPTSWAPSGTQSWCQGWFCLGRGAGQAGATSQARMSWKEPLFILKLHLFHPQLWKGLTLPQVQA